MGQDYPDWGGQYNDKQFFPLFDQAELAARLGSFQTYDRRGSLLWQDNFFYGRDGVIEGTTGTGSLTFLTKNNWESPPFSLVLQAGSTEAAQAYAYRQLAVPQSDRIGFQASVRLNTSVSRVYLNLWHYDGSQRWRAWAIIDQDTNQLLITDEDLSEVEIQASLTDLTTGWYFAHFKMVVDISTHQWVRVLLDETEYDVSAYGMSPTSDATAKHIYIKVTNEGYNLVNTTVNVDNLIVTAAEPDN